MRPATSVSGCFRIWRRAGIGFVWLAASPMLHPGDNQYGTGKAVAERALAAFVAESGATGIALRIGGRPWLQIRRQ